VLSEQRKLDFIREIGQTHMRALDGADDLLQLYGLLARLCKVSGAFEKVGTQVGGGRTVSDRAVTYLL